MCPPSNQPTLVNVSKPGVVSKKTKRKSGRKVVDCGAEVWFCIGTLINVEVLKR
jgi:hypothetical protein